MRKVGENFVALVSGTQPPSRTHIRILSPEGGVELTSEVNGVIRFGNIITDVSVLRVFVRWYDEKG